MGDGNDLDVDVEEDVLIEEDVTQCNEWTAGIMTPCPSDEVSNFFFQRGFLGEWA